MDDLIRNATEISGILDSTTKAAGCIYCPAALIDICRTPKDECRKDATRNAGLLLSQVLYWFRPVNGRIRARIEQDGHIWIAKAHNEWWAEIRLTEREVKPAMGKLIALGFIIRAEKPYKFAGRPVPHYRPDYPALFEALAKCGVSLPATIDTEYSDPTENIGSTLRNVSGQTYQPNGIRGLDPTNSATNPTESVGSYTETSTEKTTKRGGGQAALPLATGGVNSERFAAPVASSVSVSERKPFPKNADEQNMLVARAALADRRYRRKRKGQMPDADRIEFLRYFLEKFRQHTGEPHPVIPLSSCVDKLATLSASPNTRGKYGEPFIIDDLDVMKACIDDYFATEYMTKKRTSVGQKTPSHLCKRHISHFLAHHVLWELYKKNRLSE